jgi:hypothetical protein
MCAYSHWCQTVLGGISSNTAATAERCNIHIYSHVVETVFHRNSPAAIERLGPFGRWDNQYPGCTEPNSFLITENDHRTPQCIPSGIHPEGCQSPRNDLYQQLTCRQQVSSCHFPQPLNPRQQCAFLYDTSLDLLKFDVPQDVMCTHISEGYTEEKCLSKKKKTLSP